MYPNIVQDLTNTFLHIISGGEPVKLVEVTICVNLFLSHNIPTHLVFQACLTDHDKQKLFASSSGSRR